MTTHNASALAALHNQMVTQQVRAWNVTDLSVLEALRQIPREDFVPASLQAVACADAHLPLPSGQLLLAPNYEGKILQTLSITDTDQVLVIGAANAHLAACAAKLAARVTLLDADATLLEGVRGPLLATGLNNIALTHGDPLTASSANSYDAIIVTSALATAQPTLEQALKINGRLFAVIGAHGVQEATKVTRSAAQSWRREILFETVLPYLSGAAPRPSFAF